MFTHASEIAEKYADRIVRLQGGKIVLDSHPFQERPKPDSFILNKTGINFMTAISFAFNNIKSKKGRTFLTATASVISIISIILITGIAGARHREYAGVYHVSAGIVHYRFRYDFSSNQYFRA